MHVATDINRLEEELAELAAHLHAGTARFLELLGEFDARNGWWQWTGIKSCAHWVMWRCGFSIKTAREQVRVARALRSLPAIAAAFASGKLSYSKVRAITRIAKPETEAVLLEWAIHGTASQMERIVRGYRTVVANTEAASRHAQRRLDHFWDDQGCLVIKARLAPEDGVLVVRALEAAITAMDADGTTKAERGLAAHEEASAEASVDNHTNRFQRARADALVRIAETSLASGDAELDLERRAVMLVHVGGERHGETSLGPPLTEATLRRLACDAGVIRVDAEGNLGRRSRRASRAMRRALGRRDGGCRFPACTARRVDAHHITHWIDGGETSTANLVLLCRTHHRLIHDQGFAVQPLGGGEFEFLRPDGRPIRSEVLEGNVRQLRALNAGHRIDADTPRSWWDGRRPDYNIAIEGLFHIESRR